MRQWARRGKRPRQPADQRYKSTYLFGAICRARGIGAALALPYADTEARAVVAIRSYLMPKRVRVARNRAAVSVNSGTPCGARDAYE